MEQRVREGLLKGLSRRCFLGGGSAVVGAAVLASPFVSLAGNAEARRRSRRLPFSPDYGPLTEVKDVRTGLPLLSLPKGFYYVSFGWTGDPLMDGSPTPAAHDGMAVVQATGDRVILVRNHEIRSDAGAFSPNAPVYDPQGGGGTTNIEFNTRLGQFVKAWASLTGTITNCAGGPTPWNSWFTCEEDTRGPEGDPTYDPEGTPNLTQTHGWVFEVPAFPPAEAVPAEPIRGMGRFVHEATATDPHTHITYLTEDTSVTFLGEEPLQIERASGFYRFIPGDGFVPGDAHNPSNLAQVGGRLQMLAVVGQDNIDLSGEQLGAGPYNVRWVDIAEPENHGPEGSGVFQQGFAQGGAAFQRLEGAWYANGLIYFISTSGGGARDGQVWVYDPTHERLWVLFESDGPATADNPDNITVSVSPRGGLLLCEDGDAGQFLLGLTPEGETFRFCRNSVLLNGEVNGLVGDFTNSEFAGATFDPTGQWLFVNIQTPGITFAITGPWSRGVL
jgi:secreted PhoX family phosphatase